MPTLNKSQCSASQSSIQEEQQRDRTKEKVATGVSERGDEGETIPLKMQMLVHSSVTSKKSPMSLKVAQK